MQGTSTLAVTTADIEIGNRPAGERFGLLDNLCFHRWLGENTGNAGQQQQGVASEGACCFPRDLSDPLSTH